MIKLFNRIRKNLLAEGKLGKYLQYALGEILLVMIGILLALQVNNWNEERKDGLKEQALYRSLQTSLESDLKDVNHKLQIVQRALHAQKVFMTNPVDSIKTNYNRKEMQDLLYDLIETSRSFFPNYGLYNKISVSNQIDLIQSVELQRRVIELYEQHYKRYNDIDLNLESQALEGLTVNFFSEIQPYSKEYGRYNIGYDLLEKHYPVLQQECRKINILTMIIYESMTTCKREIESLQSEIETHMQ